MKFPGFQFANQIFKDKQIVEGTSAQAYLVDRRFFSEQAGEAREDFDQAVVEPATDYFRAYHSTEIFHDGAE